MHDWIIVGVNSFTFVVIALSSWFDIKRRTRDGERIIAMERRLHDQEGLIYNLERRLYNLESR